MSSNDRMKKSVLNILQWRTHFSGNQAFSLGLLFGILTLLLLICFGLAGDRFVCHSATEQNLALARIKPIVRCVSFDKGYCFLSDAKNIVVYDEKRYIPAETKKISRSFQEITFLYQEKEYTFQLYDGLFQVKHEEDIFTAVRVIWNSEYPFGTDLLGRCYFARNVLGLRLTLIIAFTVALLSFAFGLLYGTFAGFSRGFLNTILIRWLDILCVIPQLLLVILIQSFISSSVLGMILALSCASCFRIARIIRGAATQHKEQEYYYLLSQLGASQFWIIRKHVIPNLISLAFMNTIAILPVIVTSEASLSFLGLGLKYPNSSLGTLCSGSLDYLYSSAYLTLIPMTILVILLISIALISNEIKEKL